MILNALTFYRIIIVRNNNSENTGTGTSPLLHQESRMLFKRGYKDPPTPQAPPTLTLVISRGRTDTPVYHPYRELPVAD